MRLPSHNCQPLPGSTIRSRLIAIVVAVFLVGASGLRALATDGGAAPAKRPKNAAQSSDLGERELWLHFRLPPGMTWPAGFKPQVYAESDCDQVRLMWQPENRRAGNRNSGLLPVVATGSGEFKVRLFHSEQPFYVAIHAPGFLRFFERGPFRWSQIKNGRLEIDVEKPGTFDLHFDPGSDKPEKRPFDGQLLNVLRRKADRRDSYMSVASELPFDGQTRITDLAGGDYIVGVETVPKPGVTTDPKTMRPPVNPGIYVEKRRLTLRSGQSLYVDFHYVPFDLHAFRGSRSAALRVLQSDGKPVANKDIWVGYFDAHYGGLTVFEGSLSGSVEVVLKDITDRVPEIMPGAPYLVFLGNRCLGRFGFSQKSGAETFAFRLWPGANDPAPDAELFKVADGKPIKLSSLRGKFVWIDFWATWCGPCQAGMQELDEVMADEPARWKDRVVLIPVSIDENPELVTRHLAKRGWTHLEHYWSGPSNINGFQSRAARLFVIDGVPTAFLIGPDGRILWRGSPIEESGGKSMKARIEEALRP